MRINIIQHTPNERPGYILDWAHLHHDEVYIYHPYQFGYLPLAEETDMLVIMGGPMSVNDDVDWIISERQLILTLIQRHIPIFGACFGAQQLSKALGGKISHSPKEVGWAPVYLANPVIKGIPNQLMAMHWHGEQFTIPSGADRLFSSHLVKNQGFVMNHRIVGLQFHFEMAPDNVRELVTNDFSYINGSELHQSVDEILGYSVPEENRQVMYQILDYITENYRK